MKTKKFSPCKINLMLAITGARPDGFHNLISLVAPVKFGDYLTVETDDSITEDSLSCQMEGVPCDASNLVMKAAALFRRESGLRNFFRFGLEKNVPAGAGLGGGSSNAAAALLAMNELCGFPFSSRKLEGLAAELGSDCPLFLSQTPVVMRGRGEKVFPLYGDAKDYISMLDLVLFKPDFSISTAWAYSKMRENPADYIDADFAEAKISEWLENPSISGIPYINNMQIEAFKKYPALEIVLEEIRRRFGIPAMMSGSGSACFAVVNDLDAAQVDALQQYIRDTLGSSCFLQKTTEDASIAK